MTVEYASLLEIEEAFRVFQKGEHDIQIASFLENLRALDLLGEKAAHQSAGSAGLGLEVCTVGISYSDPVGPE